MKYKYLAFVAALFSVIIFSNASEVIHAVNDFEPESVFPTWDQNTPSGVIGKNQGALKTGESRLILYFVPRLIDILLKFVSPIIAVMFIYSGIRFVYAGDSDDQLTESKKFFHYALMGFVFIVLSYSIMKAVYFLLK